ncbi:MAG: NAD-dependent epimerase/dehydratase family protein [Opitutales bacterium]
MRILIVGGTVFVGRALTDAAMARGHAVTLLNRGKSAASLPVGVEHLAADRDADLRVLRDRSYDAVIDTCAYFPRQVRVLLGALAEAPHYTLISSVSAYADPAQPGLHEASPLAAPDFVSEAPFTAANYGALKSACEQVVRELAGPRSLVVRPGIIVGPHDPTGRFGYWMRRLAGAGDFVAPGDGLAPLQVIDVRDLAGWIMVLVEQQVADVFNAVGPVQPLTFRELVTTGLQALRSKAHPVWVPDDVLLAEQAEDRLKLPLWVPRSAAKSRGFFAVDGRKAWAADLMLRPLAATIADCSRYEASQAKPVVVGPAPAEEHALLRRFRPGPA